MRPRNKFLRPSWALALAASLAATFLAPCPVSRAEDVPLPMAEIFLHGSLGQQKSGNTVVVQCDISNTGSVPHEFPVSVKISNAVESIPLPFQSIFLKPSEFGTLTFHYNIPPDSPLGQYTVIASVWQVEGPKQRLGSRVDSQPFELVLGEVQKSASADVQPLDGVPAPGAKVKIKAKVSNTGKTAHTFPVSLHLMGASEPVPPVRQSVTLDPQQSKTVTFSLDMPITGIDPNALLRLLVWDRTDDKDRLAMPYSDVEIPLNSSAQTRAEVSLDTQIGEKTRGEYFPVVCNVKNTGDTRYQFPVKLEIRDASDEMAITPKSKSIILRPRESKKVEFKIAVKEMGSYRAVTSVWKDKKGKDVFLTKFSEAEQAFTIKNPAEGDVQQNEGNSAGDQGNNGPEGGAGQPPKVRIMDIVVAAGGVQKTPIRAEVEDPTGVVSCRLYYHLAADANIDFVDMNLYSGDEKKGIWVGEVDLSAMEGKIVFYAEAANTESLVGRSKEYALAKMATPPLTSAPAAGK